VTSAAGGAGEGAGDVALFERLAPTRERLLAAIGEVVVGQREVVDLLLCAAFSDGHCLFVGVPGLAKTLLVHTVAETVGLAFGRIQFTPDLMPSDITGTDVLEEDRAPASARSASSRARCSPTSCWPTRSTGRPPRPRRRCCRPCRSAA
jgi:MoxR-like ATPase